MPELLHQRFVPESSVRRTRRFLFCVAVACGFSISPVTARLQETANLENGGDVQDNDGRQIRKMAPRPFNAILGFSGQPKPSIS
jgi:hypothetical protein